MERREFLKIAVGVVAGGATFVATAQAAPLMPQPLLDDPKQSPNSAQPAVTSKDESDRLQPEEVRHGHGHGRHGGWHRGRHRGWHRRRWHRHRWHRRRW